MEYNKEYTKEDYDKILDEGLGVNHPIQTNNKATYDNQKSMTNISIAEDNQQGDQI